MKFLIDECLSGELVQRARERGYVESHHVVWLGWAGLKDWQLMAPIVENDWTFVTRNAVDFRGPANAPGSKGQYRAVGLHAGLICLNAPTMDLDQQLKTFEIALEQLAIDPDLVNKCLEITLDDSGGIQVRRYDLPPVKVSGGA